jgi:hypothetical protein
VFLKSQVLVLDAYNHYDDIYTKFTINNIPLECSYRPNHQYRLNKWFIYSDIEIYGIASGYQNVKSILIMVINRLCFPGGFIDINYDDYTSQVYDDLSKLAHREGSSFRRKSSIQYVIEKKQIVEQIIENNMDNIEMCVQDKSKDKVENKDEDKKCGFNGICIGYIYLLREREFFNNKENVYKVGRTVQKGTSLMLDRLKAYKKGSELVMIRQVPWDKNAEIETSIVKGFQKHFKQHSDGREYFIGDVNKMMDVINEICSKE